MTTLTIRNTGGTDHLSYDAVGLPGFQFIQDEVEYDSRTHHSNMDVYERVQAHDMMRNAVIVASFVLQHREPRREAAAQAAAQAEAAAGRGTQPYEQPLEPTIAARRLRFRSIQRSLTRRRSRSAHCAQQRPAARALRALRRADRPATAGGTSSCSRRRSPAR